jgi:uncharacterized membrane protein
VNVAPADTSEGSASRFSIHGMFRIPALAWLLGAVAVYFGASLYLSWLREVGLDTTTWDLGIYQQALWSTAHGRPFFEAADLETGGYHSLLQVHPVFLLYLIDPIYAALPAGITLFVIQSAVVAGAAIPLYLLAKDLTRSPRIALGAALLFLVWTPVLSANLYDFHAEAFLPIEVFTTVLLWQRARYWAGILVATLTFLTFELGSVLLFFVGLYYLLPSLKVWRSWRNSTATASRRAAWSKALSTWIRSRQAQASLALAASSLAAYYLLFFLRVDYLSVALGTTPLPATVTGYVIGGTPGALGLSLHNLAVGLGMKIAYWLILLALLGFVPLLAPRALVVSLPWFGFTLLTSNLNYVALGWQYGFVAASSLFIAFAFGLPRALRIFERYFPRSADAGPARPIQASALRFPRGRGVRISFVAFAALVAVNLFLSPANPAMQNHGLGGGYQVEYDPPAGFAAVQKLAAIVPADATVIASDDLFPLVANDENAFSFPYMPDNLLWLPFNATSLPEYVLVDARGTTDVPAWLQTQLYDTASFGVRGVAWSSAAGTILLFERGYSGGPTEFGPAPVLPEILSGASLVDSQAGYVTASPTPGGSSTVANRPGTDGTFFFGPWTAVPGGNFSVQLELYSEETSKSGSPSGSDPVLWIGGSGFAQPQYFGETFDWAMLSTPGWRSENFTVSAPAPTLMFAIQGVSLSLDVQIFLKSVTVTSR